MNKDVRYDLRKLQTQFRAATAIQLTIEEKLGLDPRKRWWRTKEGEQKP
jgi:hypothetical protein